MKANEPAWVQVSVDGRPEFIGTLQSNETKEVAAEGRVRILTGNAGGLGISLNGKALDALGASGKVRAVTLTAEGPQFPGRETQAAPPDPL